MTGPAPAKANCLRRNYGDYGSDVRQASFPSYGRA